MNLDFYKNFTVVAETGNITTAAERLNLVQPALSKQLTALEEHYGVKLIEKQRGRRQIVLTEAGIDFLRRAKDICKAEEGIVLDMQAYKATLGGTIRLSISPAATPSFMDKFLLPFSQSHPEVNFQLHEETVVEQIPNLKNDLIDLAYANAPLQENASFNFLSLQHEPFYAVYKSNNSLAFRPHEDVTLEQLRMLPLCCNFGCYGLLCKLCEAKGFTPEVRFIATTGTAAAKFAEAGTVVAVVSSSSCSKLAPELKRQKIAEAQLTYQQTLFWSKSKKLSPLINTFIAFVKAASQECQLTNS